MEAEPPPMDMNMEESLEKGSKVAFQKLKIKIYMR